MGNIRRPLLALLGLGLGFLAFATADELVLVGGGRVSVDLWWEEDDTLFYETDAGTIGIPRDQIVEIVSTRARKPRFASAEPAAPEAADPAPRQQRQEIKPRPTLEQIEEALSAAEIEHRRAGMDEARQRKGRRVADLLVLRARMQLERGLDDRALADYDRSLTYAPTHRLAILEQAWLLLRHGRADRAFSLVEIGLINHPDDSFFLELRGELFYRDNRLRDALADFTAAAHARPEATALAERVEKVRRDLAAEHSYTRKLSRHFILRYDGDRDERLGRQLTEALEIAWDDLTRELDIHPSAPITVILYTREQFRETTGFGREVGGLFDGKIRLPAGGIEQVTPAVVRVLRHELTHALLHSRGSGKLPRWLHEGMAQLLEPRDANTVRPKLVSKRDADGGLDIEPFSYPKSLSFVDYLDSSYSRTRLIWLIELLAQRSSETDALQKAFGVSRASLIEEWERWLSPEN